MVRTVYTDFRITRNNKRTFHGENSDESLYRLPVAQCVPDRRHLLISMWNFYPTECTRQIAVASMQLSPVNARSVTTVCGRWQAVLSELALLHAIIMPHPLGGALSDNARLTSVCLSVCLTSVWRLSVAYIGPKSRPERSRKTKIGTEVAHVTHDSDTTFKIKRSKVKVTRPLYSPRP